MVWSRYARSAVEVRSWCGRSTLVVCSRYARGAVKVRLCASGFRYTQQCGSGAVLHFNFLSGGTVIVGGTSELIRIIEVQITEDILYMLEEPSIILRLSCLLYVFINTGVGSIQLSFRTIVFTQNMQRCFQSKCYYISVKLCRGFALQCFSLLLLHNTVGSVL